MQRSAIGAPDRPRARASHEDQVQHRHLQALVQGGLDRLRRRRARALDGRGRSLKCSQQTIWKERMAVFTPIDRSAGVAGLMMVQHLMVFRTPGVVPPQRYNSPMTRTEEQTNSRCRMCLLDGTPDTLGRRRQVDMRHPEFTQAVHNGIANRPKCRRNSTFSAATQAERMCR